MLKSFYIEMPIHLSKILNTNIFLYQNDNETSELNIKLIDELKNIIPIDINGNYYLEFYQSVKNEQSEKLRYSLKEMEIIDDNLRLTLSENELYVSGEVEAKLIYKNENEESNPKILTLGSFFFNVKRDTGVPKNYNNIGGGITNEQDPFYRQDKNKLATKKEIEIYESFLEIPNPDNPYLLNWVGDTPEPPTEILDIYLNKYNIDLVAGTSMTLQCKLLKKPTTNINVNLNSDNSDINVNSLLIFTPENYNISQYINVITNISETDYSGTIKIQGDNEYNSIIKNINVNVSVDIVEPPGENIKASEVMDLILTEEKSNGGIFTLDDNTNLISIDGSNAKGGNRAFFLTKSNIKELVIKVSAGFNLDWVGLYSEDTEFLATELGNHNSMGVNFIYTDSTYTPLDAMVSRIDTNNYVQTYNIKFTKINNEWEILYGNETYTSLGKIKFATNVDTSGYIPQLVFSTDANKIIKKDFFKIISAKFD